MTRFFCIIILHRLINIKCPNYHCKNLVIPHQELVIFNDVLHGDEFVSNSFRVYSSGLEPVFLCVQLCTTYFELHFYLCYE